MAVTVNLTNTNITFRSSYYKAGYKVNEIIYYNSQHAVSKVNGWLSLTVQWLDDYQP